MFYPQVAGRSCSWGYARQMVMSAENSLWFWKNQEIGPTFALISIAASIFADKELYLARSMACFIKVNFKKFQNSRCAYESVIS